MSEETLPQEDVIEANQQQLIAYGEVFYQLLKFQWFRELIETKVDIVQNVDHENKVITLVVAEVPYEVTQKRIQDLKKAQRGDAPRIVLPS